MSEKEIYSGPNFRYRPDKNNFTEKEGSEFFYYESGQLKAEYNYKNGKLDGFAREYYENGQLIAEGNYSNGKLEGISKMYYESGQLRSENSYKDNLLNGISKTYYENGQLKEEVNYKDGQVVQENLETDLKDFCNIAYENDKLKLQYFTNGATAKDISEELKNAQFGEKVIIAQFFLSDRGIINDIRKAARRGVKFEIILNNSTAGFPNKAAAGELMKYARKHNYDINVKFYNKGEEMYHVKMLSILKKDYLITYGGSTNFTRRNMRNFNLENELKIMSAYDQKISKDILDYYDRLWTNRDGEFTLPYDDHKNEKLMNDLLFRFMEMNGFGVF